MRKGIKPFLLISIAAICYMFYRSDRTQISHLAMENEQHYYHRWIKINQHLYLLSQNCRMGNMLLAQNTFEDLRQEWLYQDVLARTSKNDSIIKYHFPSDSLQRLDTLLAHETENVHYLKTDRQIILEIKRINDNMDRMFTIMQQGGASR